MPSRHRAATASPWGLCWTRTFSLRGKKSDGDGDDDEYDNDDDDDEDEDNKC